MKTIFLLLVIYQIKHFAADYPLQGRYMLGKFKPYPDYIKPLLAHAAVHAAFTAVIALFFVTSMPALIGISLLDGAVHFIVDRVKASPDLGGRWTALSKREMMQVLENMQYYKDHPSPNTGMTQIQEEAKLKSNQIFWWALGADQMAHHLTHYLLIYLMLR